jgi:hypothetical protein
LDDGTFTFESDASKGGIDVRSLVGVSTRDPEEFKAEVARRKEFSVSLANVEAAKEAERQKLQQEFATLLSKEQAEKEAVARQAGHETGVAELQQLLRARTANKLNSVETFYQRGFGAIEKSRELLGDTDNVLSRDDGIAQAEEVEQILREIEKFQTFLAETEVSGVSVPKDGVSQDTGLQIRGYKGATSVGIGLDGNPFAHGQLFQTNAQQEERFTQLSQSGLAAQLKQTAKSLRAGRAVQIASSAISEGTGLKGAGEFLGDLEFAVKQDLGQDSVLGGLVASTRSAVGFVDTAASGVVGLGFGVAAGEGGETLGALQDVASDFASDRAIEIKEGGIGAVGDQAVDLFNLAAGRDNEELRQERSRIDAIESEAERNLAQRALQEKENERRKQQFDLLTFAATGGVGAVKSVAGKTS